MEGSGWCCRARGGGAAAGCIDVAGRLQGAGPSGLATTTGGTAAAELCPVKSLTVLAYGYIDKTGKTIWQGE